MPAAKKKTAQKAQTKNTRNVVVLEDGVLIDLDQVQAYRHHEGSLGVVHLIGGGEVMTHCGQELIFHIMNSD